MRVASTSASTEGTSNAGPLDALRLRYLEAQLTGNRREALQLIEQALADGHRVVDLQLQVVSEAQRELGRLWQQNRIGIAQEHMATAISQVVLSRLLASAPEVVRLDRTVMVACVEGELHDLPARLIADVLELEGFEVKYLGANVPTEDLLKQLEASPPDLLALSVTMTFHVPSLQTAVGRVRERLGARLPILAGGHALQWSPAVAEGLGLRSFGPDPKEVVAEARRLLELPSS